MSQPHNHIKGKRKRKRKQKSEEVIRGKKPKPENQNTKKLPEEIQNILNEYSKKEKRSCGRPQKSNNIDSDDEDGWESGDEEDCDPVQKAIDRRNLPPYKYKELYKPIKKKN